jgi:hypothetical protein
VIYLLAGIALVLMTIGYWIKHPALGIAAGVVWIIEAGLSYSYSTTSWDVYFAFYVVSIGLALVALLESFGLKPKEDKHEQLMDDDEDWKAWDEGQKHFQARLDVRKNKRVKMNKN